MRVGEPLATKVWHWVGFAPNYIVQDPITCILKRRADAENIVIAAYDPNCAMRLENSTCGFQPIAGELVIDREAVELVPMIIDRIHFGIIRPM